ncbi:MAG: family 16 glycoside hydrolase [Verrucomicrobiales bacterium]
MKTRSYFGVIRTLVALCWAPLALHAAEGTWIDLFDGETLKGWVQRGGKAQYRVEEGTIVGRTAPKTSNSFLCTERLFGDFILELDFKVDSALNSGIQIRSNSVPGFKSGRVHGYQVEIDPGDRGWSGGIYDESRRGWLNSLAGNRAARNAFRQGDWNQFRVEAIGDSIRTWINGVAAADLMDSMTLRGFIALQVHSVDREDPLEVRWRKIRVQDLGRSRWSPALNGRDLEGWTPGFDGSWSVEKGVLRGRGRADEKRHNILVMNKSVGDFTARVVYRANTGNSGVYFRAERTAEAYGVLGIQAEIDSRGHGAGGLYETGGRKWLMQPSEEKVKIYYGVGEWNEMTITARGPRLVTHVNGALVADLANDPGRREGFFGLQLHGGQEMDVEFRSVEFLVVPAAKRLAGAAGEKDSGSLSPVVAEGSEVVKLGGGFSFTEGPAEGPDGRIYFSDIPNERIHVYDPESGEVAIHRENSGRANGLMWTPAGALIACEGGSRQISRTFGAGSAILVDSFQGKKLNSPNDLVLDGFGGLYFSDPRYGKDRADMEQDAEAVYYLPRGGEVKRVCGDLAKPNGLILSPGGRVLYVADPGADTIWAYDVAAPGLLRNKRKFGAVGSDGMTVDERGNIYVTFKGEVIVFAPGGQEVDRITPPEGPANITIAGPKGRTLYMTARTGFYSIKLNVRGLGARGRG